VITYIFVFFGWKFITGQLSKIPVAIIPDKTRPKQTKIIREKPERASLFNMISIVLTIPFVVITMVLLVIAGFNPNHVVVVHYDRWNEYIPKLILFSCASVIIFINAYIQLRKF
jgi:hypothetical protein